jgi:predicted DNA binding CopG/RHH family protein
MKSIPNFKNEDEEREFWKEHDSSEYVDWGKGKVRSFSHLRPSLKSISIRLPESMIDKLKVIANKKDVPYQSLMKIYLSDIIERESGKIA